MPQVDWLEEQFPVIRHASRVFASDPWKLATVCWGNEYRITRCLYYEHATRWQWWSWSICLLKLLKSKWSKLFRWGWHCWLTDTFCVCDLPGHNLKKLITDRSILSNGRLLESNIVVPFWGPCLGFAVCFFSFSQIPLWFLIRKAAVINDFILISSLPGCLDHTTVYPCTSCRFLCHKCYTSSQLVHLLCFLALSPYVFQGESTKFTDLWICFRKRSTPPEIEVELHEDWSWTPSG